MSTFNKAIVAGAISKIGEIRTIQYDGGSTKYMDITVAADQPTRKNKAGEIQNHCDFINVQLREKDAEFAKKYLSKGSFVFVEGYLHVASQKKDGGYVNYYTIRAENLIAEKNLVARKNKAFLLGRLSTEVSFFDGSLKIGKFNLAVDRKNKDKSADFIPCTVFGKQAEFCKKYFKKGMLVLVEGHINTSDYEKDGTKFYSTTLSVDVIDFAEKKNARLKTPEKNKEETAVTEPVTSEKPSDDAFLASLGLDFDLDSIESYF